MARKKRNYQGRYPLQAEIAYRATARRVTALLRSATLAEFEPEVGNLVAMAAGMRADAAGDPPSGGWAGLLRTILDRIAARMIGPLRTASAEILPIGTQVAEQTRGEWRKTLRQAYGVDITRGEPWMADALAGWEQDGIGLITKMPDDTLGQIRGEVTRALLEGQNPKTLIATIKERLDVSDSRAELIGRDQVGKLRGSLDKARQEKIGVAEYFWRTMGDERVRPSHRANSDRKFAWNKPPAGTGHPGHDVRCRCYADPILPGMTEEEVALL